MGSGSCCGSHSHANPFESRNAMSCRSRNGPMWRSGPYIDPRGNVGAGIPPTPPEKPQEHAQKIPNFHPKFPPESFGSLIDRCALKNWSYFWWSHADSMESNPVLSRKTLRKVLGCRRNPGPLMSSMSSMSSMPQYVFWAERSP